MIWQRSKGTLPGADLFVGVTQSQNLAFGFWILLGLAPGSAGNLFMEAAIASMPQMQPFIVLRRIILSGCRSPRKQENRIEAATLGNSGRFGVSCCLSGKVSPKTDFSAFSM